MSPDRATALPSTRTEEIFLPITLRQSIIDAAMGALEDIGIALDHEEALALLHGAGARVEGRRVHIPRILAERMLASAPPRICVYDREGRPAMDIGGDRVHFTPGSAALHILDPLMQEARIPTTADLVDFARLTDALPFFTAQSTALVPGDVPSEIADSYRLAMALLHSGKPIVTGTFRGESFAVMCDMLAIVAGSREKLKEKPLAIFDCCPSSPLSWSADQAQTLINCARAGIPAEIVPAPLAGVTAPVTISGAVTQHCAETMSGIVLHQCAQPGAPVIYGGCAMGLDMRRGTPLTGAAETMILQGACAEVGKHMGLPTHGYFALSDALVPDYQAGMETIAGAIVAARIGINNIAGPGMLACINCQSLEKLLLDHEACGLALRLRDGIRVREDPSLMLPIIRDGIAQGEFLSLPHTRQWFRMESPRPNAAIELASVRDRVRSLLVAHHSSWELEGSKAAALLECMRQEAQRFGMDRLPEPSGSRLRD